VTRAADFSTASLDAEFHQVAGAKWVAGEGVLGDRGVHAPDLALSLRVNTELKRTVLQRIMMTLDSTSESRPYYFSSSLQELVLDISDEQRALAGMANAAGHIESGSVGWQSEVDRIVVELGRLDEGWASEEALVPSPQAIKDFEKVANLLPHNTKMPEIEIDDGGSLNIRWLDLSNRRSFSLIFKGNGRVIATFSPSGNYQPWDLDVFRELDILKKISEKIIISVICGNV
jgi:hypothetical protein